MACVPSPPSPRLPPAPRSRPRALCDAGGHGCVEAGQAGAAGTLVLGTRTTVKRVR
jgi:hypothetical protein